jgi:hypothetical protein
MLASSGFRYYQTTIKHCASIHSKYSHQFCEPESKFHCEMSVKVHRMYGAICWIKSVNLIS